ncbi:MAG: kelch repeat-containing protein [Limisphaerales bacterium]
MKKYSLAPVAAVRFFTGCRRAVTLMGFSLAAAFTFSTSAAVISGPVQNPNNGHFYYLLGEKTWTASEAEAVALGGHLATVRSQTENDWIYMQFSNFGGVNRGLWIGLNDAAQEGTFVWVSGEPVSYLNWGSGEPVNQNGLDDYVHLFWPGDPRASHWNDQWDIIGSQSGGIPINGVVEVSNTNSSPPSFADCPTGDLWKESGSMNAGRANPRIVLLSDGKVLAAGNGTNTEIYDSATESWIPTGALNVGGFGQTLTRLPDGKVLIAGGGHQVLVGSFYTTIPHADAEIYDPTTGLWTAVAPLNVARVNAAATLLNNGLVLLAGGWNGTNALADAELYDPVSGVWTPTGSLHTARACATATLLPNGHVLIAGGGVGGETSAILSPAFASAEEYVPATGVWTQVGAMNSARNLHTATLLPNGQVLVSGGWNGVNTNTFINPALATAELYNPATGTWTATGPLNAARAAATATLLTDGRVLVTGGAADSGFLSSTNLDGAEIYNPASGTWTTINSLHVARSGAAATLLNDGLVLVAGGADSLSSAELFGYIDLGCNPGSIPYFDPESVDTIGGCVVVRLSGGQTDATNGCLRSRSIIYVAVDDCNQTNVCGRNYLWTENTTPPILIGASNKVVQCGVCSGGYAYTLLHSFPSGRTTAKRRTRGCFRPATENSMA